MPKAELILLSPFLILTATIVITLLASAFVRKQDTAFSLSAAGLGLTLLATIIMPKTGPITTLLHMDAYGASFMILILLAALIVALFSRDYYKTRPQEPGGEYFLLLLLATLGSLVLVASSHFVSFFLGLEILSVSLYVLIAFHRDNKRGVEAGVKYLVLAGMSSAFLLFGMALIYAAVGTMRFSAISAEFVKRPGELLTWVGTSMLLVGIGFKLALAPFHLWSPDIYEGAPAPVTAFVATVSKGAVFAVLLRYFFQGELSRSAPFSVILSVLAVLSMFVGNLLALRQENVKRLLAYSSIAHLGYLLVALLAGARLGASAAIFYVASYFATTLAAFGVVASLSGPDRDADRIEDYQGMFWQRPLLGSVFLVSILSLAGIPLTAGFIGKFYVASAGVGTGLWALVILLVLNSALGLYYYLRLVGALFSAPPAAMREQESVDVHRSRWGQPFGSIALIALALILV